jgi:hypothetical protein
LIKNIELVRIQILIIYKKILVPCLRYSSMVWSIDFGLVGPRFESRQRNWKRALHFFVAFELRSWKIVNPRLEYMEFHIARSLSLHPSVSVKVNSCYQVSKKSTIVFCIINCTTVSLLLIIIKEHLVWCQHLVKKNPCPYFGAHIFWTAQIFGLL